MALASRGAREIEGGTAPITDAALVAALKRKARIVYAKTAIATIVTAVLTLFL